MNLLLVPVQEFFNMSQFLVSLEMLCMVHANDSVPIADSAQTEYCPTFHCLSVCPSVTGVTSHISHIYKGINAMLIIRGPIKPYVYILNQNHPGYLSCKDQTRQDLLLYPDQPAIDFNFVLSKI